MTNRKMSTKRRMLATASATVLALYAGSAFAQTAAPPQGSVGDPAQTGTAESAPATTADTTEGVADIIVTAERRESSVQRTAASVTVRSGDALRAEGKTLLRDIIENIPGIAGGAQEAPGQTSGGGSDTAGQGIVIRGIRSNEGAGGNITSVAAAVAVYTDDVYEGIGNTYDIDRVEVLRGPQGTLYGRSATGGVVAIRSRDPDLDVVDGFALLEIGDYGLRHVSAAFSAPIVEDALAIRVSGDYLTRNGFDTHNGLGYRENKNARIKLLAKPVESLTILVGAALQDNADATGGRTPARDASGNLIFNDNPIGAGTNKFRQVWANFNLDLGFASLTYIPAYRQWKQDAVNVGIGPGFRVLQTLETPRDHFWTHEVRLASSGTSDTRWQIGALSYDNSLTNSNAVRFDLPGSPLAFQAETDKKTRSVGVFGEVTVAFTDALRVTGGLRYDYTKIEVAQVYIDGGAFTGGVQRTFTLGGDAGKRTFNNWTYKARAEYDASESNLFYASFSTGFSPGDVSVTSDATGQPFVLTLEDQTLYAYEVGSKNRFFDNKLQANASIYYYYYTGYQNARIDTDPGPGIAFTTFVAPMKNYGGELELLYQATPADRIALNLAYTNARFVDQPANFRQFIARDQLYQVPPFTANLIYSHRFDLSSGGDLTLAVDARYMSSFDGGTIKQSDIALGGLPLVRVKDLVIGNLNATWTSADGRFSLSGYVRNVTDKRYPLLAEVNTVAGAVTGATIRALSAPRTFGLVGSVNF